MVLFSETFCFTIEYAEGGEDIQGKGSAQKGGAKNSFESNNPCLLAQLSKLVRIMLAEKCGC